MNKYNAILFLALATYVLYLSRGEESRAAFFVDISDEPNKEKQKSSMFRKIFHQCSVAEDCKFVTKNIKTNKFKKVLDEDELPADRENYKIWKKQKIVKADENRQPYTERGKKHAIDLIRNLDKKINSQNSENYPRLQICKVVVNL